MLLVASETGHVYTFATRKLQPMITSESGKALIQTCLNSPDPPVSQIPNPDQRMSQTGYEETDLTYTVNENEAEKMQQVHLKIAKNYISCTVVVRRFSDIYFVFSCIYALITDKMCNRIWISLYEIKANSWYYYVFVFILKQFCLIRNL